MILPYVYDPVTQDLWLYESVTISWTSPSPGSQTIKRPYAWNPNSPLYGYRKSLSGMTARPRQLGNPGPQDLPWTTINDPANPVNQPVYYNSFPFAQWVVSRKFMTICSHCYSYFGDRNPSKMFIGVGASGHYQTGSYLHAVMTQAFRWIDGDNQLIQELDPTLLMAGYTTDLTNYPGMVNNSDTGLVESYVDLQAPPIKYVDMRSLPVGYVGWLLDSNHKIIRARFNKSFVDSGLVGIPVYTLLNPDGSTPPYSFPFFEGDSSSSLWVELVPPTSKEAGDGVLGFACGGISSSSFLTRSGQGTIATTPPLEADNDLWDYMASRGYPVPAIDLVTRRWRAGTERIEQEILTAVQGISFE